MITSHSDAGMLVVVTVDGVVEDELEITTVVVVVGPAGLLVVDVLLTEVEEEEETPSSIEPQ